MGVCSSAPGHTSVVEGGMEPKTLAGLETPSWESQVVTPGETGNILAQVGPELLKPGPWVAGTRAQEGFPGGPTCGDLWTPV